jgi:hypothetical protein
MESVEEPSNGKEGVRGEIEEEHAQQEQEPQGSWRASDFTGSVIHGGTNDAHT